MSTTEYRADRVDASKTEAMTLFSIAYQGVPNRRLAKVPSERWAFNFVEHPGGYYCVEVGDQIEARFDKYANSPYIFPIPEGRTLYDIISDELQIPARHNEPPIILINGAVQAGFVLTRQPMRSEAIVAAALDEVSESLGNREMEQWSQGQTP